MNFNKHSELVGTHATFGASQSAWLRYDISKMVEKIHSSYRVVLGTEIHEFAASQIKLCHKLTNVKSVRDNLETYLYLKYLNDVGDGVVEYGRKILNEINYLPKEVFETVKTYIHDGILFKMTPEQPLVYSLYFYGTTDCISFRDNILRIHDLKTGSIPAHIEQLEIYAALFCLEYNIRPIDISIELRIYQNDEILHHEPTANDIVDIMELIRTRDKELSKIYEGV